MLDEIALLAALGRGDFDAAAGARAQRLGKQLALLDLVREQHEARRGLSS